MAIQDIIRNQHEAVRNFAVYTLESSPNSHLPYHDLAHSVDDVVCLATGLGQLALTDGLITEQLNEIIITAAYFHDVIQGFKKGLNEDSSAAVAMLRLNRSDVPSLNGDSAELVGKLIPVTKVEFTENDLLQGHLTDCEPEQTLAADILCDADLGLLGMPFYEFLVRLLKLHKEQTAKINDLETRQQKLLDLANFNILLLSEHEWRTGKFTNILRPHMRNNALEMRNVIKSPTRLKGFLENA